jgi:hypothetical protein
LHAQFSPKRGRWVYMRDGVGGRDRSGGVPSGRPAGGLQSGRGLWLSAGAQWVTSPRRGGPAASFASARRPSRLCGVRPHERGPSPQGQGLVPGGDGQPADGRGLWGETERGEGPAGQRRGFRGPAALASWCAGGEGPDGAARRGGRRTGGERGRRDGGATAALASWCASGLGDGGDWHRGVGGRATSPGGPRAGRGTVRDAEGRAGVEAGRRSRSSKKERKRKKISWPVHTDGPTHAPRLGGWTERSVGLYCRIWLADMSGQQPRIPKPSRTLR